MKIVRGIEGVEKAIEKDDLRIKRQKEIKKENKLIISKIDKMKETVLKMDKEAERGKKDEKKEDKPKDTKPEEKKEEKKEEKPKEEKKPEEKPKDDKKPVPPAAGGAPPKPADQPPKAAEG